VTKQGQKFALSWINTDSKETFELKVNNDSLNALKYLDSGFKLSDDKVNLFRADISVNGQKVTSEDERDIFEHQAGLLTHKILKVIGEDQVTSIQLSEASLETEVMNETIASFSQLDIPKTGLYKLEFNSWKPTL